MCQKKDAEKAAQEGVPLKLDTLVEDRFTHEASVRLHLDMIVLTKTAWPRGKVGAGCLWEEMLNSIPEVKSIFLDWFGQNWNILSKDAQGDLKEKLLYCDVAIRKIPGYDKALEVCNV